MPKGTLFYGHIMNKNLKIESPKKQVFLVALLFFCAYGWAWGAPFYLDDFTSIVENPWIRDGNNLERVFQVYKDRAFGYVTFWLNFHYIGTSPEAFRGINYLIHVGMAFSVYWLSFLLIDAERVGKNTRSLAALAAGLVFLLHPLNTQAVVYVVQRLASLTAFWVVLSCCFFYLAKARHKKWLYLAAVGAFGLAFFTKQNAIVTPVLWYFIDRFVIERDRHWRKDTVFLLLCSAVIVFVSWLYWPTIDRLTRETTDVTRLDYFLAQGPILWQYIANFFYPVNLRLEYGLYNNSYPLWLSTLAWVAHVAVWIAALRLTKKLPLVTLGVAWYYCAHVVESSFIPISDFAFEHRTYLPNVGLIMALIPLLVYALRLPGQRGLYSIAAVILVLTGATAYRNYQWADPYLFYQNEFSYNPDNQRVKNELARYALDSGEYKQGLELFEEMLESGNVNLTESLLINLMVAYGKVNQWEEAEYYEQIALQNIGRFHPSYRARIYLNQGIRLKETGQCDKAYDSFSQVQKLFPGEFSSLLFRTQCDLRTGNLARAQKTIRLLYQQAPKDLRVEAIVQELSERTR